MRFRRLSLLLLGPVLLSGALVAGEPKEEGGKNEVMKPLPKEQKEYWEKTAKLNTYGTRIEEAEKQFNELVRRKASEKNPEELERIIKLMNETTKERNKSADEYNRYKSEIALRYPNQGEHLNRQYQTQTRKSVEELEGAAGLDELLTRTKKIVDKKYAPFAPPDEAAKAKAVAKPEEEKPEHLRLEK